MLFTGPISLQEVIRYIHNSTSSICGTNELKMEIGDTGLQTCVPQRTYKETLNLTDISWYQFSPIIDPNGIKMDIRFPGGGALYILLSNAKYATYQLTKRVGEWHKSTHSIVPSISHAKN